MSGLKGTRWENSRRIVKRVVIRGTLWLKTPAQVSNGDAEGLADMTLLRDPLEGRALLTGTSIAGALRAYLRQRELGYGVQDGRDSLTAKVFGPHVQRSGVDDGDPGDSEQSYLIVEDALGEWPETEFRNGVTIHPKLRTAEDKKLYNLELLAAGQCFRLEFELLIPAPDPGESPAPTETELKRGLAIALMGLELGEIPIGARKRRGLGECQVEQASWSVEEYDLTTAKGLVAWLSATRDGETKCEETPERTGQTIAQLLGQEQPLDDRRSVLELTAEFGLAGSMLIRSGAGDKASPDMVHLTSKRGDGDKPVLSGTSLGGALRARARRIGKTVGEDDKADAFVDSLFGLEIRDSKDRPIAGRLWVAETEIVNPLKLVLSRVKIDRFTGGSYPGALFNEQPVFGTDETKVTVRLAVTEPNDADIGLLLLLLRDLWTEDLPVGGEAAVGRGRLRGKCAALELRRAGQAVQFWEFLEQDGELRVEGDRTPLQDYVDEYIMQVGGTPAEREGGTDEDARA